MSNNEFDDGFSGDEPDEASGFWPLVVSLVFVAVGMGIGVCELIVRAFER